MICHCMFDLLLVLLVLGLFWLSFTSMYCTSHTRPGRSSISCFILLILDGPFVNSSPMAPCPQGVCCHPCQAQGPDARQTHHGDQWPNPPSLIVLILLLLWTLSFLLCPPRRATELSPVSSWRMPKNVGSRPYGKLHFPWIFKLTAGSLDGSGTLQNSFSQPHFTLETNNNSS